MGGGGVLKCGSTGNMVEYGLMKFTLSVLLAAIPFATLHANANASLQKPAREPIDISAREMLSGRHDYNFVRIVGTIQDVFRDENNSQFRFFIINSDDETIYAPSRTIEADDATLDALIGAKVAVAGTCDVTAADESWRRQFRRNLYIWNLKDITVLEPPPKDPFNVKTLEDLTNMRPADIPRLGRRSAIGKVLAVWNGGRALLERPDGSLMRIEPKDGKAPKAGSFVEAAGIPESDIYRVNLTRVVWRPAKPFACATRTVTNVTAQTILTDPFGHPGIKAQFHGRTVRLTGLVRSMPQITNHIFFLQDGLHLVPIDTTAAPAIAERLQIGAAVSVTGVCITEVEPWRPGSVFPRTTGATIVLRTEDDLTVVSKPTWWTPAKFLGVISALILVLAGVLIWNRSLHILAEKRGRILMREQIGRVKNRLKVGERTRLAVELHDSLAQILTGISFEIKAAGNFVHTDPENASHHLVLAARLLLSCRTELRNCLFELRSRALEAPCMDDAIRQTLLPHLGSASLALRFNVPRARIADDTTHALLRIIRELASNAVRHGRATEIRIAGILEGKRLAFSVTDNGSGFDPKNRPGVTEGHFGLQGVRERVAAQGGSMTIRSRPGAGARVSVSLTIHSPEEEDKGVG